VVSRKTILNSVIIVTAGLCVVAATQFERMANDSLWLSFLAGFHPVVLHLPIGILVALVVRTFLPFPRGRTGWLWGLAAVTSTAAFSTGLLLGAEGGYDEVMLNRHLWAAAVFTGFCWIGLWAERAERRPLVSNVILGLSVGAMTVAGHFGGIMVHGDPLAAAPWRLDPQRFARLPPLAAEVNVYSDLVTPILGAKCVSCHGPAKQNGRLRLDDLQVIQRGGHKGLVVAPGRITNSELIRVIELPLTSDDHMPPIDHHQVTEVELAVLRFWIEKGANDSVQFALAEPPASFAPILDPDYRLLPDPAAERARLAAEAAQKKQNAAERQRLQIALDALPTDLAACFYFSDAASPSLAFSLIGRATLPIAESAATQALLLECEEINTAGQVLPIEVLTELARSEKIQRLNLRDTAADHTTLALFADTPNLRLLNFYGTNIDRLSTIAGGSFSRLEKLFLGYTDLSPADLDQLRQQLPNCEVTGNLSLVPARP
jgi:hypothetical protein